MDWRKYSIAVCLSAIVLVLAFIPYGGSQTKRQYDPWADTNDDGIIDMTDIGYSLRLFATSGDPTKNVVVTGYGWNQSSLAINITPKSRGSISIPVARYRQVTVAFNANMTGVMESLQLRTGFKLKDLIIYEDRLNLPLSDSLPAGLLPANSTWVEPAIIRLYNPQLGQRFNVTVWARVSVNVMLWQVYMTFDNRYLRTTKVGLTAGSQSQFFLGLPTISPTPVINNKEGYILYGEAVLPPKYRGPGAGSLCWVEFEVIGPPEDSILDISISKPGIFSTSIETPTGEKIKQQLQDAKVEIYYTPTKTYNVKGPIFIIEYYNPNDKAINLIIEIYATG